MKQYLKLKTAPIQWESPFCIAKITGGNITEIEGRWIDRNYCVALSHIPEAIGTYNHYGFTATDNEWYNALAVLYRYVANTAADDLPIVNIPVVALPPTHKAAV